MIPGDLARFGVPVIVAGWVLVIFGVGGIVIALSMAFMMFVASPMGGTLLGLPAVAGAVVVSFPSIVVGLILAKRRSVWLCNGCTTFIDRA